MCFFQTLPGSITFKKTRSQGFVPSFCWTESKVYSSPLKNVQGHSGFHSPTAAHTSCHSLFALGKACHIGCKPWHITIIVVLISPTSPGITTLYHFILELIVFVRPMGCLVKKHTHILPNDGFMVIDCGTIRKKITKQQIINPSV